MAEAIIKKTESLALWYRCYKIGLKNKKARKLLNSIRSWDK